MAPEMMVVPRQPDGKAEVPAAFDFAPAHVEEGHYSRPACPVVVFLQCACTESRAPRMVPADVAAAAVAAAVGLIAAEAAERPHVLARAALHPECRIYDVSP